MSNENETQTEAAEGLPTDYDGHVMRTPDEWCRIKQIQILDADGWRGHDAKDWSEPLTELDFEERAQVCTQRSTIPLQESPITGPQYPGPLQPSGVTIGGTSGPWPAGEPIPAPTPTAPAGEHHTGTLNLTGEGNAPEVTARDIVASLLWVEIWDGDKPYSAASPAARSECEDAADRILTAAYPAIRQQVAEEIAVAIEACTSRIVGPLFQGANSAFEGSARLAREIGGGA